MPQSPHQSATLPFLQRFYLVAAIVGAIAPYATYYGFLHQIPGASGALSLAWGSPIAAATLVDFSISCVVFWPFLFSEARRLGIRHAWWLVFANLLIGLSFALPAFLYLRERRIRGTAPDCAGKIDSERGSLV